MANGLNLGSNQGLVDPMILGTKVETQISTEARGVFKDTDGMSGFSSTQLVEVHDDEDMATSRASELNTTNGVLEYEVSDDPETSVFLSIKFSAAKVTLKETEVMVVATYEPEGTE